jgi:UDP-N-acetylmuramoyl-L-alanyl-D-glutamate--2,6-diaminopimelate ligase
MTVGGGVSVGSLVERAGISPRTLLGDPTTAISGVVHDSRDVVAGSLYCCIVGERVDGHDLAPSAVAAGANALAVQRQLDLPAAQVVVDDTRAAMAPLAAAFWDNPSHALTVVGVTGTSGKTTTTHLLAAVFDTAGWPCGVIGTLSGAFTTPEAPELQARLAAFRDEGRRAVAMEVSSHALEQHRADAIRFAVAVFTNLSRDHMDYHGTIERYFAAKARLFEASRAERAVVNLDDPYGQLLADAATVPTRGYSLADARDLELTPVSSTFTWQGKRIRLGLGGRFNVANALAAGTAALEAGLDLDVVVAGLAAAGPVPGRFEAVDAGQPFTVVVDYSHKPGGLAEVLDAARALAAGKVLVVFGAGGDRDRTKRPLMGQAAAQRADVVVVTSDNPRHEDPSTIIDAVLSGIPAGAADVIVEPDRRAAISLAIDRARPGDVLVIAGKGHETTQITGDTVVPFDDRVVARELLEARR